MSREMVSLDAASETVEAERRALRRSLSLYATGVCVVTTLAPEGEKVGLTVNSFASVSLDPPLVLWSLAKTSPRLSLFRGATHFAINVLSAAQEELCNRFARPGADRFAGLDLDAGAGGAPLLPGCLATFECARHEVVEGGDHIILIGRVVAHRRGAGAQPLVFCNGALRSWPSLQEASHG
ncbi:MULTISPECIES: flavin reductase family protein [unclassified Xanthobacter]|uniref:flavin reductase family protein n=1 Tax=unclassified Xanthobacter TaxID=2623496 RepID=UPI001F486697|nr:MULTISPECIES: flavin reductase family protein [unclassified Xanthobacter]